MILTASGTSKSIIQIRNIWPKSRSQLHSWLIKIQLRMCSSTMITTLCAVYKLPTQSLIENLSPCIWVYHSSCSFALINTQMRKTLRMEKFGNPSKRLHNLAEYINLSVNLVFWKVSKLLIHVPGSYALYCVGSRGTLLCPVRMPNAFGPNC